ncbi:MAG: tetratricopeptide repeat protein [Methanobacterium sp.]
MSIGPTIYFGKERDFVDREECIQVFKKNIENLENEQCNVLFYHGMAGIGKSALQKKLQDILNKEYPDIFWVSIDFDVKTYRNIGTFLIALRNRIQEKCDAEFDIFNAAHLIYWNKLHPDLPLPKHNYPPAKKGDLLDNIFGVLDNSGKISLAWEVLNQASDGFRSFKKWMNLHYINISKIESYEPNKIEELLPGLFAADLYKYLRENSKVYIFVDTYEALWEDATTGSFHAKDSWIRDNLIQNMLGVSWVISGREKLLWTEREPDWNMYLEQKEVDELPESCCAKFLEDCSIENKDIRDVIIKASERVPYYLNLSVDTYEQMSKNGQPTPGMFGKTKPEIYDTFVKYLNDNQIQALKVLSVPNLWDRDLFEKLMREFGTGYPTSSFPKLINFSFIKTSGNGKYCIHQLMRKSLQKSLEDEDPTYRQKIHLFLRDYYCNKIEDIDIKSITNEHEIALTEAFYHGKEALGLEELTEWLFEYSEPFDKAARWKLIQPMFVCLLDMFTEELGEDDIHVGVLLKKVAHLNEDRGKYDAALSLLQKALITIEKNFGMKHYAIAMTLNDIGNVYLATGKYLKALEIYQKALKMDIDPLQTAVLQQNIGKAYHYLGEYNKALKLCEKALPVREKFQGAEHIEVAKLLEILAVIHQQLCNYKEALTIYQKVLRIQEKNVGYKHPAVASTLSNLGNLYILTDKNEYALEYHRKAVEIADEVLDEGHVFNATALNNLGAAYRYLYRYDDSLKIYQQCLVIAEQSLGSDNINVAHILCNMAEIYCKKENYDKALELYQNAFNIAKDYLGEEHDFIGLILNNVGRLYIDTEEYEKAHPICQRALDIREKTLGPHHVDFAITLMNLVTIYENAGRLDDALSCAERSLQVFEQKLGPDHIRSMEAKLVVKSLEESM